MNNVLITGANGFIGRAVCKELRTSGFTLSGTSRDVSLRSGPENIPLHHVSDLDSTSDWSPCLVRADTVVHLAARVHEMKKDSESSDAEYQRVNTNGTLRLAKLANDAGVKRFIFLSTIKVNGEKTNSKAFSEVDTPRPADPYSVSKWEAEKSLSCMIGGDMEIVILRVPLVYGPHVRGNFLSLMEACFSRRWLPLGGINNSRSFLYVGNLASAITATITNSAAADKTFMVSDGQNLSTPELIKRMARALGVGKRLYSVPMFILKAAGLITGRIGTIDRLSSSLEVDSSFIRKELNWTPPFSAEDGLNETARWFLSCRK
ncbi:MAG: NAD-dependent epimerase/dehydratase family protein [Pseudomonadota bacterium]|nr:NAD-dependent epimerase/dehydratase family protein [Pseudomonadota bacterium]